MLKRSKNDKDMQKDENLHKYPIYMYMYVHFWKIWNLCVWALETGRKEILWWVLLACIAGSANKFHFIDNIHTLTISKSTKTTAKFYWKDHKQEPFQSLSRVSSVMLTLYCYRFLLFALQESGNRRLLFCILDE